jgi:hypothetical protein
MFGKQGNLSWLALAGAALAAAPPGMAQERFGERGILFEVDTVVEFRFVQSNGAYRSTFGVINLETNEKFPLIQESKPADNVNKIGNTEEEPGQRDFLGTPGNAVPEPFAEFEFEANTPYAFYLESTYLQQPAGVLFSVPQQNPNNTRQVQFRGGFSDLASGGVRLRWDDTGSLLVPAQRQDSDFNDFVVEMGGHLACPIPPEDRPETATGPQSEAPSQESSQVASCHLHPQGRK